ncbi:hypothetical protein WJX84_005382 [Apatococcus fuscideae]|uniref:Uncharacterized protein n=1 Tax=Apatococcus fuscideae TaxID=2026836 RepID=A0AAW1SN57_9CHLO
MVPLSPPSYTGGHVKRQALQRMKLHRENVCPDHLLTDRAAYISYLESQLEHVTSACMTVSSFEERLEAATATSRSLTMKVTDAKLQEMRRTTDNNVAQRLAQLEAAAAETAAVHEAMQAAHCRQRLESTCQAFRTGMQSLTDERIRLSKATETSLPADQRAQAAQTRLTVVAYEADRAARRGLRALSHAERRLQALAAQLPSSSWTQPAPTQPVGPYAPNPLPVSSAAHSSLQGVYPPSSTVKCAATRAPLTIPGAGCAHACTLQPTAMNLSSNDCSPREAFSSLPSVQPAPALLGGNPLCSPAALQHGTGPSLSGWLGPGDHSSTAMHPPDGSPARNQDHSGTAGEVQQSEVNSGHLKRQQIEHNLAEQTQAVESVLQGVQASFTALHEAMAESARQQELLRQQQEQERMTPERQRRSGGGTPGSAGRARSHVSGTDVDVQSAAPTDVDRPTASSVSKMRRSASPAAMPTPSRTSRRPWGSPTPALRASAPTSTQGREPRQSVPRKLRATSSSVGVIRGGERRERLQQLYADLKALDEESLTSVPNRL